MTRDSQGRLEEGGLHDEPFRKVRLPTLAHWGFEKWYGVIGCLQICFEIIYIVKQYKKWIEFTCLTSKQRRNSFDLLPWRTVRDARRGNKVQSYRKPLHFQNFSIPAWHCATRMAIFWQDLWAWTICSDDPEWKSKCRFPVHTQKRTLEIVQIQTNANSNYPQQNWWTFEIETACFPVVLSNKTWVKSLCWMCRTHD